MTPPRPRSGADWRKAEADKAKRTHSAADSQRAADAGEDWRRRRHHHQSKDQSGKGVDGDGELRMRLGWPAPLREGKRARRALSAPPRKLRVFRAVLCSGGGEGEKGDRGHLGSPSTQTGLEEERWFMEAALTAAAAAAAATSAAAATA